MPNDESRKNKRGIHDGHRERLRNKYFEAPYTLEDHEILEFLLFYAVPQRNTNNIAHKILDKYHSFEAAFKANDNELKNFEYIKENAVLFLHFFGDLCNDYRKSISHTNVDYVSFFREKSKDYQNNTCIVISEDRKFTIQFDVFDFLSEKYKMSKFVKQLIKMQISNVVICIFKKGISATPDISDIKLMDKMNPIFYDYKINVIDSLIISETNSYSLIHDGAYKFKKYG